MRNLHSYLTALTLLSATALPAQLSGTYTIDPAGSGARNYKSFTAASFDLFTLGVNRSVQFDVAPGTYTETWLLYPVAGATQNSTVTFRSKTPGATVFSVTTLSVHFMSLAGVVPQWIVFDGFSYRSGDGKSHRAMALVGDNTVVRSCTFSDTTLEFRGDHNELHHCRFTGDRTPLEFNGVGGSMHHNEIRLSNARARFASIHAGSGRERQRVYNNLFSGDLYESNSYAMTLGGPMDFVHNTVVQLRYSNPTGYPTIELNPSFAMIPELRNNIIVNLNSGALVSIRGNTSKFYVNLRNNLYWAPGSQWSFLVSNQGGHKTLASWQSATGQDAGSLLVDPQLVDPAASPTGLEPKPGSPAVAAASATPTYVTDDFAGTARKNPATIGAYEGFPKSTFVTFGKGCAGAGGHVPAIGSTGAVQLGSANFAVTLTKARGGAVQTWFVVGVSKVSINFGGVCNLLVAPDLVLLTGVSGTGPGNGTASIGVPLPNDPKLRGAKAHFQWAVIDSAAAGGLAFSNAATLTL